MVLAGERNIYTREHADHVRRGLNGSSCALIKNDTSRNSCIETHETIMKILVAQLERDTYLKGAVYDEGAKGETKAERRIYQASSGHLV